MECASTCKDPSLRAHLLTLSQASRRPCVRLWPVQPRVLCHYHDRSDEPRDLCHSTTIHRRLIELLLQRYYAHRSPASRICPDARISLASKSKAAGTLLQAHLSRSMLQHNRRSALKAIKQYAIQQLHFIADHHGIENVLAVVKILESGLWREEESLECICSSWKLCFYLLAKAGAELVSSLLFTCPPRPETYVLR